MSDPGLPGPARRGSRRRKALIYFGLAEDDPTDPLFPKPDRATTAARPAGTDALARIEAKLERQTAELAEMRAQLQRLIEREP